MRTEREVRGMIYKNGSMKLTKILVMVSKDKRGITLSLGEEKEDVMLTIPGEAIADIFKEERDGPDRQGSAS